MRPWSWSWTSVPALRSSSRNNRLSFSYFRRRPKEKRGCFGFFVFSTGQGLPAETRTYHLETDMTHHMFYRTARPVVIGLLLLAGITLPVHAGIKQEVTDYLYEKKAFDVVQDYAGNHVLKTLSLLSNALVDLKKAAVRLDTERSDKAVADAADAWQKAMALFNNAWVFNYGPAAQYNFDKQLATWPFDKYLVDYALTEMAAGRLAVDSTWLRTNKHASMRGLHTVQYLLFHRSRVRNAADISPIRTRYLLAVCQALVEEGFDFEASWKGTKNLSAEKKSILKNAGMKERPGYAYEFVNPGEPDSRYVSISIPLQEIFQECSSVVEDLLPGVEELKSYVPDKAPYWAAADPYADLLAKLDGVEDAYLGGVKGARDASISELVAKKDAVLDRRIKAGFAHAKKSIADIRALEAGLLDEKRDLMVRIALSECEKLMARLTAATPIVTADPALNPWAAYGL